MYVISCSLFLLDKTFLPYFFWGEEEEGKSDLERADRVVRKEKRKKKIILTRLNGNGNGFVSSRWKFIMESRRRRRRMMEKSDVVHVRIHTLSNVIEVSAYNSILLIGKSIYEFIHLSIRRIRVFGLKV